jgi:hypothetical protein
MEFVTPRDDVKFTIPQDWWSFAEMSNFNCSEGVGFYPPLVNDPKNFTTVLIAEIEPPLRTVAGLWFRKYKLMPILFAFQSPECALPLVVLSEDDVNRPYKYKVINGFHRYYASVAVGFSKLPVRIL